MKQIFFVFGLLATVSCSIKTEKNQISIEEGFLQGEWMLDSIIGKDVWKQDWVYFTDDNKYWRFSKHNETYLIESELDWTQNKVLSNNKVIYTITALDSGHIILDNGQEKFHASRWMPFDREDIDRFLKADPIKRKINGWWELDKNEIIPIKIPSFCNNLDNGTKLYFNPNGIVEVFPNDSTGNHYCKDYSYSVNVWDHQELSLVESDMVIGYEIVKLDSLELILRENYGLQQEIKLKRKKQQLTTHKAH